MDRFGTYKTNDLVIIGKVLRDCTVQWYILKYVSTGKTIKVSRRQFNELLKFNRIATRGRYAE